MVQLIRSLSPVLIVSFMVLLFVSISFGSVQAQNCSEVFISEYVEGSSWNKAVELYNSSPTTVDLRNYEIRVYYNGDTTPTNVLVPQDSLLPGDVFVVAHNQWALDSTHVDTFYGGAQFNGDDAVALFKDSTQLDGVGRIGQDPGSEWTVGSGSTKDNTLVRADTVLQGDTNWTLVSTQWEVYPQDQDSLLGWHRSNCLTGGPTAGFAAEDSSFCENGTTTFHDSSSSYVFQRVWYFEGGNPDTTTGTNPTVSYDSAGQYDVTQLVTNINGTDTLTKTNYITVASRDSFDVTGSVTDVACHGDTNGQIDLTVTGGTSPYSFNWSNGDTSQTITSLAPDTYSVIVTDSNECLDTFGTMIGEPDSLIASPDTVKDVRCAGEANGSIDINVTGGTTPYSYSWSEGSATQDITGLSADTYSVTVTDDNSCFDSTRAIVQEPLPVTTSIDSLFQPRCQGDSTGVVDLTVAGGDSSYTYNWSNGDTTQDLYNLPVDTYTVFVADGNGCATTDTVRFTQASTLALVATVHQDVSCNGKSDGEMEIFHSGGISPFQYDWSNEDTAKRTTGLSAGFYTVTVTDSVGCRKSMTSNVDEPPPLSVSSTQSDASCQGCCDGQIGLTVSGGTSPYQYQWTNGDTTSGISNLCAGNYIVTITDDSGCTTTDSFTISQPAGLPFVQKDAIRLTPNPVNDRLQIQLPGTLSHRVRISFYDMTGRQQGSYTLNPEKRSHSLDMAGYLPGLYMVKVRTSQRSRWRKLVVR